MFGLTVEKLFVIALIAAFVIGPHRLPLYAQKLADTTRALRTLVDTARTRTETELGVPLNRSEWRDLDLQRYDPRQIMREALRDSAPTPQTREPELSRPAGKWVVAGDAAHPRRVFIPDPPTAAIQSDLVKANSQSEQGPADLNEEREMKTA